MANAAKKNETIYDEIERTKDEDHTPAAFRQGMAHMREVFRQHVESLRGYGTADGSLVNRAEALEVLDTKIPDEEIRAAVEAQRQAMEAVVDKGDPDSGPEGPQSA